MRLFNRAGVVILTGTRAEMVKELTDALAAFEESTAEEHELGGVHLFVEEREDGAD